MRKTNLNWSSLALTLSVSVGFIACGGSETAGTSKSTDDPSGVSTSIATSPAVASSDYDLQFIDAMRKHHESAVTMAKMAVDRASDSKIKSMAGKMMKDQQKEITQLQAWRDQWFPAAPAADVSKIAGASSMNMDMSHMQSLRGHQFDMMFVEMMVPHHEGAVTMSCDAHAKSQRSEIKKFARDVIRAQESEITDLQKWKGAMKM